MYIPWRVLGYLDGLIRDVIICLNMLIDVHVRQSSVRLFQALIESGKKTISIFISIKSNFAKRMSATGAIDRY